MSDISTYLQQIMQARYGEEVRGAIHDAIEECYDDVSTAKTIAEDATNDAIAAAESANSAAASATSAASSVPSIIASTFSPSSNYVIGEYVYHSGGLYRFIAPHTAGEWTGADAVSVQIAPEVSDLQNDVKAAIGNERIEYTVANGYYATSTVGATVTDPILTSTFQAAMISCSPGDTFTISGVGGGAPRVWAFLDSDHKVTRYETRNSKIDRKVIIAEPGEAYLVINNNKVNNTGAVSYYGVLIADKVDAIQKNVDNGISINNFIGVTFHGNYLRSGLSDLLPILASHGIKYVRLDILWHKVEETKGVYDYDYYDDSVQSILDAGMVPVLILGKNNTLYSAQSIRDPIAAGENYTGFLNYVSNTIQHYASHGVVWELCNEANNQQWDMNLYYQMAVDAYRLKRNHDGTAQMNSVVLAYYRDSNKYQAIKWLEQILKKGLIEFTDGVSVHVYRDNSPEKSWEEDISIISALLNRYGKGYVPIDVTETGYQTLDSQKGTYMPSEQQAGAYLIRSILSGLSSGVRSVMIYSAVSTFEDDGSENAYQEHFGLYDANGNQKERTSVLYNFLDQIKDCKYHGSYNKSTFLYSAKFADVIGRYKYALWFADTRAVGSERSQYTMLSNGTTRGITRLPVISDYNYDADDLIERTLVHLASRYAIKPGISVNGRSVVLGDELNNIVGNAMYATAEGRFTEASADAAHAQNFHTKAIGTSSSAGGQYTVADGEGQTVVGKFNALQSGSLFSVGNGTSINDRSDAFGVYSGQNGPYIKIGNAEFTEQSVQDLNDLKSQISVVVKNTKNIYNQAGATLVNGKYLNYTNGNEGTNPDYCYDTNYIPVESNTQYFGTVWYADSLIIAGNYRAFILFYDSSKAFISGLSGDTSPFTTPSNCAYIRLSYQIGSNLMMFEKGASYTNYVPYGYIKKSPFITVDKNGNGDYTTIQDAINAADEDATILIAPGIYNETISTWYTQNGSTFGKRIHLIGADPSNTILKNTSQNYSTPPLEFSNGSIRNMTIYAEGGETQTESTSCYAMHMETHSLYGKDAYFENCVFKSNVNYPIGIGLRGGGASLTFKNCDFIGNGSAAGCIWFHDADASAYRGTCYITYDGCNLICDGNNYPIRINAMHDDNLTYITFKRNVVWAKTNETSNIYNTWNTGGQTGDGWRGLLKMYLTYDSVLNSESGMNYR